MKIAFCLFKYSPYSGLSLDFLRILEECKKRGHDTHVFVSEWRGERPVGVQFTVLESPTFSLKRLLGALKAPPRSAQARAPKGPPGSTQAKPHKHQLKKHNI